MNTLAIYDTEFGNTERIAKAITDTLQQYGQARILRIRHTHPLELQGVDLLILGCPTKRFRPTRAMRSLLEYIPVDALSRLTIACFDTRSELSPRMTGSAAEFMARELSRRGASHLLPSESFFVKGIHGDLEDGELERAGNWARMLCEKSRVDSRQCQSNTHPTLRGTRDAM